MMAVGAIGYKSLDLVFGNTDQKSADRVSTGDLQGPSLQVPHEQTKGQSSDNRNSPPTLKEIAQITGNFSRSQTLYRVLADADAKQLTDMLSQSNDIESATIRAQLRGPIIERYALINPKNALTQIEELPLSVRSPMMTTIFGEWSHSGLDEALRHAKRLPDEDRFAAIRGILEARADLSAVRRQEILHDAGIQFFESLVLERESLLDQLENPRVAWQQVVSNSDSPLPKIGTVVQIADAWIQQDGIDVLAEISQAVLGRRLQYMVLDAIVQDSALSDPEGTLRQTLSMNERIRRNISASAVRVWSQTDPQSALEALADINDAQLRVSLQEAVIWAWVDNDPQGLLASASTFPSNLQELAVPRAVMEVAQTSPKDAIHALQQHNISWEDYQVLRSIVESWSRLEPTAAWQWVLTNPGIETHRGNLLNEAVRSIAREQPVLAMELALDQPAELSLESAVIAAISSSDPLHAMELLPQIRELRGTSPDSPYTSVAYELIRRGNSTLVMDLAEEVPESIHSTFYTNMLSSWANIDPEGLLGTISEFPSAELKSSAAYSLHNTHYARGALTEEQLEHAKSFLNDWDLQQLENKGGTNFRFVGGSTEIRIAADSAEARALIEEITNIAGKFRSKQKEQSPDGESEVELETEATNE